MDIGTSTSDLLENENGYDSKVEIDLQKYRIDTAATLELEKHILSCEANNKYYFRKLEHEKEMAETARHNRMEFLEHERKLLEQFGYPMRALSLSQWMNDFLTPGNSISVDDALSHYNELSGHKLTKKEFRSQLSYIGVTIAPVVYRKHIVQGLCGYRLKGSQCAKEETHNFIERFRE